jgi:hypothetical protein
LPNGGALNNRGPGFITDRVHRRSHPILNFVANHGFTSRGDCLHVMERGAKLTSVAFGSACHLRTPACTRKPGCATPRLTRPRAAITVQGTILHHRRSLRNVPPRNRVPYPLISNRNSSEIYRVPFVFPATFGISPPSPPEAQSMVVCKATRKRAHISKKVFNAA